MVLYEDIKRLKYVPIRSELVFRQGYSPDDLKIKLLALFALFAAFYFIPAESAKEKLDR